MYLGIDTATAYLCLGLWSETFEARLELEMGRDHSKRIIVELEQFLRAQGVGKEDLKGIGVGLGPGSYTGLRIGVAVAKGLARGLSVPLKGKPSLEALAFRHLAEGETALVTLDARREQVYFALYQKTEGRILELEPIAKSPKAELLLRYPDKKLYEATLPDAVYLAKEANNGSQLLEPIYL
ncbi:MAG: tRNA (adenosine(37)-N6)-threonylcarbamoyltransferase complex dimerization subunit type 1 TsaB [Trueperaceae bacterium]|nr:tRNA (adenosine(37)-N6)-threonylcarbamoyltransferase complex dimerization subunit type 1 TsaB [Trueperaceae bacterium]